ncbi:hypothetical protein HELRODRAFT_183808 [Helobdella robusta]|uniref:Uncharacterized protein n=1 Tax=Helobdella robusta TaxID=6412 RepID=T1FK81_HELRO|nr:hypothetical protein HELRODRAFT_183808 [Helobdella robusta]ESO10282.1 hypothetical protein HELRODRAFT_183808 [Helobdella robusta]
MPQFLHSLRAMHCQIHNPPTTFSLPFPRTLNTTETFQRPVSLQPDDEVVQPSEELTKDVETFFKDMSEKHEKMKALLREEAPIFEKEASMFGIAKELVVSLEKLFPRPTCVCDQS